MAIFDPGPSRPVHVRATAGLVLILTLAVPLGAQQAAQGPAPDANTSSEGEQQSEPPPHQQSDHIFGVLPNYTTVERDTVAPPITTRQTFRMAALNSFDPYMFPFVAFVAGINQLQDQGASWPRNLSGYGKRYAAALTDNTFGNFMTTAIMPTLLDQDPRYFELGRGSMLQRAGYALTRSVVSHDRSGHRQFNTSEIGGNAAAAMFANVYYPRADRSLTTTLTRWGMQVMWDSLSNELKEFWPDIRRKIRRQ
jgi:hypothetical protein